MISSVGQIFMAGERVQLWDKNTSFIRLINKILDTYLFRRLFDV